jgi:hypothetical protein
VQAALGAGVDDVGAKNFRHAGEAIWIGTLLLGICPIHSFLPPPDPLAKDSAEFVLFPFSPLPDLVLPRSRPCHLAKTGNRQRKGV